MNRFKKIWAVALLLVIVSVHNAWASDTAIVAKNYDYDRLLSKSQNDGTVKIIITLGVPKIKELTAAATRYKEVNAARSYQLARASADDALGARIAATTNIVRASLGDAFYQVNHTYKTLPFLAIDASADALEALASIPEVLRITEDRLFSPALDNTVNIIGANNAWDSGYTGQGWYVAVLDTGIRKTHELFSGKTIIEACYSGEGHCPNDLTEMTGSGAAVHHPNTFDGWDHGTHVTGIATGKSANLSGVGKDADIIAIQVFSRFTGEDYCAPYPSPCVGSHTGDQIKGLEYVFSLRTTYKIAAVNMSLGGGEYSDQSICDTENAEIKAAIDNLRDVGIATIVASGNDGYCDGISAPACVSSAIAVGATTDDDAQTKFSNWHSELLDLFAPGEEIYSSHPDSDSSFVSWPGTSMAAPHVAGAWALLRQKNAELSVSELLDAISNTGVEVTTICQGQSGTKPRVQIDAALNSNALFLIAAPSNLTATAESSTQIDLSWTDNSANESGFKIERKAAESGTYAQIATVSENVSTFSDIDFSEGITYYYRVRSYNSNGDSGYSNEANVKIPPSPPSNLSTTAESSTQIDLSWTDNSANESGFKIERKADEIISDPDENRWELDGTEGDLVVISSVSSGNNADTYVQIATVSEDVTSFSDTDCSGELVYYYRVRSYNSNGDSDYSNEATTTTINSGGGGVDIRSGGGSGGGSGCFIATAAFGSSLEPNVQILRQFRDRFLIDNKLGNSFVRFYNAYSPPIADFIANYNRLRSMVRALLLPAIGMSWVALRFGFASTMLMIFFFGIGVIGLMVFLIRNRRPRRIVHNCYEIPLGNNSFTTTNRFI